MQNDKINILKAVTFKIGYSDVRNNFIKFLK
jgi:hypothetical protein